MKTPVSPPSSKGKGKAEESAPTGKTPMGRFREASANVFKAPPAKVRAAEEAERVARQKSKKSGD